MYFHLITVQSSDYNHFSIHMLEFPKRNALLSKSILQFETMDPEMHPVFQKPLFSQVEKHQNY